MEQYINIKDLNINKKESIRKIDIIDDIISILEEKYILTNGKYSIILFK